MSDRPDRPDAVFVCDEWPVRDQSAIVRQLGHDVIDWTRELIHREGGPERQEDIRTPGCRSDRRPTRIDMAPDAVRRSVSR